MRLRIRAPGSADFEIDVEPSATVGEAKIMVTSGCDVDPEAMKLICRGRVLRDGDTLQACGIDGTDALHVARGKAPPAPAAAAETHSGEAPSSTPAQAPPSTAGAPPPQAAAAGAIRVIVRGPGGVDSTVSISPSESVLALRAQAASICGFPADHIHLVHRGRILKDDGASLTASNINDGDVLRVARRAVQEPSAPLAAQVPAVPTTTADGSAGSPMPMAWGSSPATLGAVGEGDPGDGAGGPALGRAAPAGGRSKGWRRGSWAVARCAGRG
uniref:Ubiquitin-like domain-containing protein n=1 Tax=Alexandrium monilatum TaxID=311494 RepID=A0A7S4UIK0_9DINO|mmetsp:Transcript_91065/g.281622  ORF Transcript_91065/g.281622 Transcript_91065/m.281622 type:complete len:272 (+) Transcript_91065:81-896(+)